jgi:hypothetical protein
MKTSKQDHYSFIIPQLRKTVNFFKKPLYKNNKIGEKYLTFFVNMIQ